MRKLALKDAFAVMRIIKAAGIRNEIIKFASEIHDGKDVNEIGMEFVLTLIQAASDESVELKLYQLYADLKGVDADEIGGYDFDTVKADVKTLVALNNLNSFFKYVSALMSKQ